MEGGLLISFERMNTVLEVDTDNHVAVVQPGVTLTELDARTAEVGLSYTVYPGELSSSVGGNVGTNAGGMRAVKYGVTRHNVLGLQAVLPTGEIIRTGGKMSKISSGYDLTQLIIGSEGTLALVTEVTVKLVPKLAHGATVLAPFGDFDDVMAAVPEDHLQRAGAQHRGVHRQGRDGGDRRSREAGTGHPASRSRTPARHISWSRWRAPTPSAWRTTRNDCVSRSATGVHWMPMCCKALRPGA